MNHVFYEQLGKKIRDLRIQKGLSQQALAQQIGKKSASSLNLIECGKRRISLYDLMLLSKAMGVTLDLFFDVESEAKEPDSLLHLALISDPNLTPKNRKMVLEFIDFLRTSPRE